MTRPSKSGITLLTIGLAVAALAGIPALVENRTVGDVVVVVGFAVAAGGIVLLLLAIPGQLATRRQRAREHEADIDDLKAKRESILDQIGNAELQLRRLASAAMLRPTLAVVAAMEGATNREDAIERRSLEVQLIALKSELRMNANDLKRKGVDPGA